MTCSKTIRSSLICLSLAAVAGCGGSVSSPPGPGDTVLVDSATAFSVISSSGGFGPLPPQGAACDPGIWTYGIDIGSSTLAWDRCNVAGTGSQATDYTRSTSSRTLSPAELDTAVSAARMVHVSTQTNSCGADKGTLHMSVTSNAGTTVYGDDFYACLKMDQAYVVSASLDNLSAVLYSLVGP
jgi:hypothetical protein